MKMSYTECGIIIHTSSDLLRGLLHPHVNKGTLPCPVTLGFFCLARVPRLNTVWDTQGFEDPQLV